MAMSRSFTFVMSWFSVFGKKGQSKRSARRPLTSSMLCLESLEERALLSHGISGTVIQVVQPNLSSAVIQSNSGGGHGPSSPNSGGGHGPSSQASPSLKAVTMSGPGYPVIFVSNTSGGGITADQAPALFLPSLSPAPDLAPDLLPTDPTAAPVDALNPLPVDPSLLPADPATALV